MLDSDDDSLPLPPLSELIKQPKRPTTMSKGDIVWAKYKNLYWPALVRAVYPKKKKISIWYTDLPGKTFMIPQKNTAFFHDTAVVARIKKEMEDKGEDLARAHEGLTDHAKRYLRRRSRGIQDDPLKYFDQTYPYFLMEKFKKKHPGEDIPDLKISPLYITHEKRKKKLKTIDAEQPSTSNITVVKETSISKTTNILTDEAVVDSTESEDQFEKKTEDLRSYFSEDPTTTVARKELEKIVVDYILSGNAMNYLRKVFSKEVPSYHRDIYEQSLHDKNINYVNVTGPVDDCENETRLIKYLLELYDTVADDNGFRKNDSPFKRFSSARVSYNLTKSKYVGEVWLPESIIYAISIRKKVSLSEARDIFFGVK